MSDNLPKGISPLGVHMFKEIERAGILGMHMERLQIVEWLRQPKFSDGVIWDASVLADDIEKLDHYK